jgi:hypothetical protein
LGVVINESYTKACCIIDGCKKALARMNVSSPNGTSNRSREVREDGEVITNHTGIDSRILQYANLMSPKHTGVERSRSSHYHSSPRKQTLQVSSKWQSEKAVLLTKNHTHDTKKRLKTDDLDGSRHGRNKQKTLTDKSPVKSTRSRRLDKESSSKTPPLLPMSAPIIPVTPKKPSKGRSKKTFSRKSPDAINEQRHKVPQKLLETLGNNRLPLSTTDTTTTPAAVVTAREKSRSPSTLKRRKEGSRRNLQSSLSTNGDMNSSGSSLKVSSHHSNNSNNSIPMLYRLARKGKWDECLELIISNSSGEDLSFVYKKDGTTALHLAVMSRTGYIHSFSRNNSSNHGKQHNVDPEHNPTSKKNGVAPMQVVEELLKRAPYQSKLRCTLNGYTPLTYACLVCNDDFSTESAAVMVRLFIQYCPESITIFSDDGLSPVDIHIVSYSHHHKEKEEESGLGNTSTAVLRTLLNHAPELANLRLKREADGVEVDGPLELLYKCNAQAFSKATMDEVYNSDDEGTIQSDYTLPEKRQQVMDTVKTWWIWTWAVILLKYGSKVNNKKRGARFAAVHTAANQIGVPTPLLSICLYAFPRQIKKPIEETTGLGNLPLHAVCSWPCHHDSFSGMVGDAFVTSRKVMAINRVLEEYPLALKVNNARGESALELALKSGTTWDGGVRRIVKAYPKALKQQSKVSGLYPFMTAAAAAAHSSEHNDENISPSSPALKRQELRHLRTIYGLLRSSPKALALACQHEL